MFSTFMRGAKLWKSETLEKLCDLLAKQPFDKQKFFEKFSSHPKFANKELPFDYYFRAASKIHLINSLENIANNNANLRIELNQVISETNNNGFRFNYDYLGSLHAMKTAKPENAKYFTHYEYPKVIKVKNLFVVFNIKLTDWKCGKSEERVKDNLRSKNYTKKLKPLRSYLKEKEDIYNLGFVLVLSQDSYKAKQWSRVSQIFEKNNGLISHIPYTRERFRKEVEKAVKLYELNVRKEP